MYFKCLPKDIFNVDGTGLIFKCLLNIILAFKHEQFSHS